MIPRYEVVEGAYRFLAGRYGFSRRLSEAGVRAALDDAKELATIERDEPAALFFALARRPRSLGGAWRVLSALVALNHAAALGLSLDANPRDLGPLYMPIVSRALGYAEIRAWFAARTLAP
jgi:hypothetical protein